MGLTGTAHGHLLWEHTWSWLLAAELPLGEEEEGYRDRVRADQRNPAAIQVQDGKNISIPISDIV